MPINNSADYQVTQYNVITGGASNILNNVAPSATSGIPVISQGSSSQPIFGTAVVAGGGTGNTTQAAYSLVCGGTTTTGAFQAVADVATGSVLVSGGTGALPSFSATPTVTGITFGAGTQLSNYAEGTFTPTMIGQSTAGSTTYTAQNGYYTRIGNLVTVIATVTGSAATGTGFVELAALPFTIKNQTNGRTDGAINVNNTSTWTWPTSATSIGLEGQINNTYAMPWVSGPGANGNYLTIRNAGFQFEYSLSYQI
jgi:hypothetical protein